MLLMLLSVYDLVSYKFVNVCFGNGVCGLLMIFGQVIVYDVMIGEMCFVFDGLIVIGCCMVVIIVFVIQVLYGVVLCDILLIGIGKQVVNYVEVFVVIFLDVWLYVCGMIVECVVVFCVVYCVYVLWFVLFDGDVIFEVIDVVVMLIISCMFVYCEVVCEGCFVVGVGVFIVDVVEIDVNMVYGSWFVVDDLVGVCYEVGDLIVVWVDWQYVVLFVDVLNGVFVCGGLLLFKSVGCVVWDLVVCCIVCDVLVVCCVG